MKKSMYSLILTDQVVEKIDQIAYQEGMSRSQLIDHLLAQQVGMATPEQKIRSIMEQVADRVQKSRPLQVKVRSDSGGVQFATYLRYKYNPGIKYSFEFTNQDDGQHAVLKVSSRSTSEDLLQHLTNFFEMLSEIDEHRFQEFHNQPIMVQVSTDSNNKFARELISSEVPLEGADEEEVAQYLSNYVVMLDEALQCYFTHLGERRVPEQIDRIYCHYLEDLNLF